MDHVARSPTPFSHISRGVRPWGRDTNQLRRWDHRTSARSACQTAERGLLSGYDLGDNTFNCAASVVSWTWVRVSGAGVLGRRCARCGAESRGCTSDTPTPMIQSRARPSSGPAMGRAAAGRPRSYRKRGIGQPPIHSPLSARGNQEATWAVFSLPGDNDLCPRLSCCRVTHTLANNAVFGPRRRACSRTFSAAFTSCWADGLRSNLQ